MRLQVFLGIGAALFLAACAHLPRYMPYHDPLNASDHLRLGNAYESQGLLEEATRQFQAARAQAPDSPEPLLALGNLAFGRGELDGAESLFRSALRKDPRSAGAANNLAMVFLAKDRLPEAKQWAQRALWQNTTLKPYVLDTLAEIYFRERRFAQAETTAEEALSSAPAGDTALTDHLLATRRRIETATPAGEALARP